MQKKLIVVIGPTSSKKNLLVSKLSNFFNLSLISADAFQVYKQINIGVNKPKDIEIQKYPHYFIDYLNYFEEFDISLFSTLFKLAYEDIVRKNRIPVLCGGSHLYIDAIVSGYNFTKLNTRPLISELDEKYTNEELYKIILNKDPEYAKKINVENRRRLLKTVALMQLENRTMTEINNSNVPEYDCFIIMCYKDREQLYVDINNRVDQMLADNKWVNEVKNLVNIYPNIINSQAFKAIGYNYIYNCLKTNENIDPEVIKQKTRHLAKTQLTWCRNKFKNKMEFNIFKDDLQELVLQIQKFLDLNND